MKISMGLPQTGALASIAALDAAIEELLDAVPEHLASPVFA